MIAHHIIYKTKAISELKTQIRDEKYIISLDLLDGRKIDRVDFTPEELFKRLTLPYYEG